MKINKITLFAIAFLLGILTVVVAVEIGDNLGGLEFKSLDVNTENWCKNIDVEKTTDHIVYWYECKDIVKVKPNNYTVEGRILTKGYDRIPYDGCRGRGGSVEQCLTIFYDEQALEDIRGYVIQLREDLLRKQRQAIITREFPPNTERFSEEQING